MVVLFVKTVRSYFLRNFSPRFGDAMGIQTSFSLFAPRSKILGSEFTASVFHLVRRVGCTSCSAATCEGLGFSECLEDDFGLEGGAMLLSHGVFFGFPDFLKEPL